MVMPDSLLNEFKNIVPPPDKPLYVGNANLWSSLEDSIGWIFPEDYKELINVYGLCDIDEFLWMPNPFVGSLSSNVFSMQETWRKTFLNGVDESPAAMKYKKQIVNGNFWPCMSTANADVFFWNRAEGQEPMKWNIVGISGAHEETCECECSLLGLLLRLFKRQLIISFFPDDFYEIHNITSTAVNESALSPNLIDKYPFPVDPNKAIPNNYVPSILNLMKR